MFDELTEEQAHSFFEDGAGIDDYSSLLNESPYYTQESDSQTDSEDEDSEGNEYSEFDESSLQEEEFPTTPIQEPSTDDVDSALTDAPEVEQPSEETPESIDPFTDLEVSYGGKNITLASKDEAITLMEMGIRYAQENKSIQENNRILATLKENKLLDSSKLNYAIDLLNNNPEAITKLIKESGINIYDLDVDTTDSGSYTPTDHTVPESKILLDNVLSEMSQTPTYNKTLNIVSSVWDQRSRDEVVSNPELLLMINKHVQLGIYDRIEKEIDRRKILGTLSPTSSSIENYQIVGQMLFEAGAFNTQENKTPIQTNQMQSVQQQPNQQIVVNTAHKKAGIPPRRAPAKKQNPHPNVLRMSDEEFIKKYGL